jgi:signal transduction histidine kinase
LSIDKNHRIWLSGPDGVAWIDPGKIHRNTVAPKAVVGSVLSEGRLYPSNASIRLPEGTRRLQVDYTALSYSQPERVQFRYRLVGVDDQWVDAGTRRQAFYTNLGPGQYEFMVTAMNESGLWSETPATVSIELSPTTFQTPAFKLALVITAIALGLLAARLGIRLVRARERARLEGGILERERIARDLHDTLLQSTQGLIWRFQAAAQQLAQNDPARASLEKVLDGADAVMSEARRRIQGLRTSVADENDLSSLLANVPQDAWRGSEVACKIVVEGQPRPLDAVVLEDTYRIGREAMLNAYRHARPKSIEVQIVYGPDQFRLRVRDDGLGIPRSALSSTPVGHWGLQGLKERALRIGAQLEIWSGENAGTEIELRMPASVAYESRTRSFARPLLRLIRGPR